MKTNCSCAVCEKEMYVKPFRLKRLKHGITCSQLCKNLLRKTYMVGEQNHQFGLKGALNSSHIGEKRINQYGYVMLYLPNHPKADENGRYREHRFVIEQSKNYSEEYFDSINNQKVLKNYYNVHHINGCKTDNREENLVVVTRSEHTTLHNAEKEIIRNPETGRIIGVLKFRELLETPEEDNQQPSLDSNIFEGSTTNSQVLTDNAEDSIANTSAEQSFKWIDYEVYKFHKHL